MDIVKEKNTYNQLQDFFKKSKQKNNSTFLDKILGNNNLGDVVFEKLTLFFAVLVFLLVIFMGWEMYSHSVLSIKKFGWDFLISTTWDPYSEVFGALPMIFGTMASSFIGLLISIPLGIGVAVFLSELAPGWLEKPMSFLTELLAGIPSVIYGLWGIFVLVPWLRDSVEPFFQNQFPNSPFFQGAPYGFGMLAAGIILSIMVLPIISSISRDVLRSVPAAQREAAYALGATRWEVIKIVLSNARSGLVGAVILGFGRAVGETMAVTMVIGNRPDISASLLDPAYTMASTLANEFTEADKDLYLSSLFYLALVLFVMSFVTLAVAKLFLLRAERKHSK